MGVDAAGTGRFGTITVNDFPSSTSFGSITIDAPGYTLSNMLPNNVLTLTGGITTTYTSGTSTDSIDTELGSGAVTVAAGGELDLSGAISGSAGVTVSGGGTLGFTGMAVNTYTGTTTVNASKLVLSRSSGTTAVPGNLTIGNGSGTAVVQDTASNQIATTSKVTINDGATLDLNGNNQTIGALTLTGGTVATGAGTLTLGGDVNVTNPGNSDFSAINGNLDLGTASRTFTVAMGSAADNLTVSAKISGTGVGLTVTGGGTVLFQGPNTYTGTTTITGSGTTLLVDGTVRAVQVNAGSVLRGTGTAGDATTMGGTISPGDSPGVLNTGSLILDSNSAFTAELDGTSPGNGTTGYDQVIADGPVNLGSAKLNLSIGSGFTPAIGDEFTIIENGSGSAVTGSFAGFPEGSAVNVSGFVFRITYQGGPNQQDVVLKAVAASTTKVSAPQSSTYGQSVTFTAQVSGNQGTPTGTVAFFDGVPTSGGTELGTGPVNAQGAATFSTMTLSVAGSPHHIYAVYEPDAASDYTGSTTAAPAPVSITPAMLTVNGVTAKNKVYDSTTTATLNTSSATLSGIVNGDNVTLDASSYTATFSTKNVGIAIPVTVTGLALGGTQAGNYTLTQPTGLTANITPAMLTVTGVTVNNKVYDTTT
jgi:autotransporter-associated beta strand protein